MKMKQIGVLDEYLLCEVGGVKMLLSKKAAKAARESYRRLAPQLSKSVKTEVETMIHNYQQEQKANEKLISKIEEYQVKEGELLLKQRCLEQQLSTLERKLACSWLRILWNRLTIRGSNFAHRRE